MAAQPVARKAGLAAAGLAALLAAAALGAWGGWAWSARIMGPILDLALVSQAGDLQAVVAALDAGRPDEARALLGGDLDGRLLALCRLEPGAHAHANAQALLRRVAAARQAHPPTYPPAPDEAAGAAEVLREEVARCLARALASPAAPPPGAAIQR